MSDPTDSEVGQALELARDGCGDNHHPTHVPAHQSRFDVREPCDHCEYHATCIAQALADARTERDKAWRAAVERVLGEHDVELSLRVLLDRMGD